MLYYCFNKGHSVHSQTEASDPHCELDENSLHSYRTQYTSKIHLSLMFSQVSVWPQGVCISGSMFFLGMGISSTRSLPGGICRWLGMSGGWICPQGRYVQRTSVSGCVWVCVGGGKYVPGVGMPRG